MPSLPLRVLVLEDHPFQRSVAVSALRQLGCRTVFEAADGAQALAILKEVGPVDIALCDLRMEGMDGLEFFQRVGPSGLVGSLIISSALSADLRRAVRQIISLLGVELLGDIGKPLQAQRLLTLLTRQLQQPMASPCDTPAAPLANQDEVLAALREQQMRAYFQPKFDLLSGEVRGVEVLARWEHPLKGTLPPSVFMSVLERCGVLDELLFEQLRQGLSLQKEARAQGHWLNVAFNLQAPQLVNRELIARIKALLAVHALGGSGLTFELTESGLLQAPATSLENLVRLRMLGCNLSIDDFGAGFSSLQRLCQLPFNEIKLDAEFIRDLCHEPRCRAVVSSTLALGEALGMSVVVEGIETQEQRQQLLALGCRQGQGFLCARPMKGDDLLRWLAEGRPGSLT